MPVPVYYDSYIGALNIYTGEAYKFGAERLDGIYGIQTKFYGEFRGYPSLLLVIAGRQSSHQAPDSINAAAGPNSFYLRIILQPTDRGYLQFLN